ncbi:MAG: type V CRISPR-associated endonuclease Cas1 [Patescibacteria group bacterium]
MLSLPDFREKQILFIQAENDLENKLQFQNDNILFKKDEQTAGKISYHKVFAIFIFGDFSITSGLIKKCQSNGISLFLLKNNFEVYAEINSGSEGNYLLREKQYFLTEKQELEIAKKIVFNKISNQFDLLKQKNKNFNKKDELKKIEEKIFAEINNKELLGIEGSISKMFFSEYFKDLNWYKRMPRTKVDEINILLDIAYTFLFNFIDALLRLYGFDVYKGVYHKLFFNRKSLSCDIMEPFRAIMDRQLLKSFHLNQIDKKDFKKYKNNYLLTYEKQMKYTKIFFAAIMDEKEELFNYVKNYYYFILNMEEKEFPIYKIK